LKKIIYNQYSIYTFEDTTVPIPDPSVLIHKFLNADTLENKGRNGIKILDINGRLIACRKYIHGGLFRAITGQIFFSARRAADELEIMLYLSKEGFPVVDPYCVIIEKHPLTKALYILTLFEENSADLSEFLTASTCKKRLKIIKMLAQLMWHMEMLGVYHPDLHLNNVLVTDKDRLKFLDFDRAYKKLLTGEDMERMFWRLNRYVDKMERQGKLRVDIKEKVFFLRTYRKCSGFDLGKVMKNKVNQKGCLSKIGWFLESLLYGKKKSGVRGQATRNPKPETRNPKLRK
jgi:3-deoxy-D-manno-octulosonic acid kinase